MTDLCVWILFEINISPFLSIVRKSHSFMLLLAMPRWERPVNRANFPQVVWAKFFQAQFMLGEIRPPWKFTFQVVWMFFFFWKWMPYIDSSFFHAVKTKKRKKFNMNDSVCQYCKTRSIHVKGSKELFIRTKHKTRIFGVNPFTKLKNDT